MDIGHNFINGFFFLIIILLFGLFQYSNNYIYGILLSIISFIGFLVIFIIGTINSSLVYLYIFVAFGLYMISKYFKNNYSIQELIDNFDLGENDILTYKFLINQKSKSKKCIINGEYSKETNYKLNHNMDKDNNYCNSIQENTNLDFIYNN